MAAGDGNGWIECGRRHRHWGTYGAAGLLAAHYDSDAAGYLLLMQRRSWWSHHGGTWGLPGGARDSHEDSVATALREAREEAGLSGERLRVHGVYRDDHGGWSFDTVLAEAPEPLPTRSDARESAELRWVPLAEVPDLALHPGFAESWPEVRHALHPTTLVLDVANIIGARAEHGWWRDRAGAAGKLLHQVAEAAADGLRPNPDTGLPLSRWFPHLVAVTEGAARTATAPQGVEVVPAPGSGDDMIVEVVDGARPWDRVFVVTADRGLRARVAARGAAVIGPRWLITHL
jgi:8-oxo-dGTP diphosphatase